MSDTNERLSLVEKVGYGMGDMAANFVFQALLALQLSFYTDTFGLTPAQAGTMFMVIGLGMAVLNPVMGVIADRTNTRWGRFRPWLLWTALPFGVIGVLTFSTPQMSLGAKIVYAWATYFLLRLIYTMNNVPYASLTGVLTGDPNERTSITSIRLIFANSAGFIVQSLAIPLVAFFGHGNNARGYQMTMGLFSALSVIMFLVAFAVTKERIEPPPGQKNSVVQDLADLMHNGPWVILFFVTTFYFSAIVLRGNLMLPYFKYCSGNQMLFSWFNGFGLTALLIGVSCSTALTKRIGKRSLFFWSMLLCGIFCCALYFVPPTALVPIFAIEVLRQFAYGCSGPVLWAMMADVADFSEWKTGRRATATVTAAVVFALWVGIALGGAIAGWLLSYYGYLPNVASQSANASHGIRLIASIYPGIAFFGTAVCLIFYGINMKLNLTISHDLSERRKMF
ncbi:glycoside-pentoside-hexuronide (GPH):cation symporter [Telmatobacter bradus]|uniref:glycoside-pentoside-hexuronide (GPH):cation symporter n=1 Tax=Telmatobacter bradus TaxID=474953 RepID=UPI003B433370